MNILKWTEKKIQRLTIWDFSCVKLALVLLGIIIGAYISTFVKQFVWYFVCVFVMSYAIVLYRVFRK
jgi:hypothetical protein